MPYKLMNAANNRLVPMVYVYGFYSDRLTTSRDSGHMLSWHPYYTIPILCTIGGTKTLKENNVGSRQTWCETANQTGHRGFV